MEEFYRSIHSKITGGSTVALRVAPLLLLLLITAISCDIKENNKETDPKKTFIKIYENNDFSQAFIPVDVQETSDGGFIHLAKRRIAESSFYGVYVMKTDALGEFVSEQKLDIDFVNPVYNLMKVGNSYYFFAMNRLSLEARLMTLSESGEATEVATVGGVTYPLYASHDVSSGQFILQHYDPDDRRTVISRINTAGVVTAQRQFNIGFGDFDVEEPVIDHLTGNGKKLPFLTGSAGGGAYFFNGFYNYTLSTVFFTFGGGSTGVLQGYKDERCISSALYIGANRFAISRYANGSNYLSPNASINTTGLSGSSTLPGFLMMEFKPDAEVILKQIRVPGRNILVYNTTTKSGQIVLYFYEESSGALLGTRHYGFSNPYEAANFTATAEGGLALVGTTYLAGRFPRIVLMKISKEELEEIVR